MYINEIRQENYKKKKISKNKMEKLSVIDFPKNYIHILTRFAKKKQKSVEKLSSNSKEIKKDKNVKLTIETRKVLTEKHKFQRIYQKIYLEVEGQIYEFENTFTDLPKDIDDELKKKMFRDKIFEEEKHFRELNQSQNEVEKSKIDE